MRQNRVSTAPLPDDWAPRPPRMSTWLEGPACRVVVAANCRYYCRGRRCRQVCHAPWQEPGATRLQARHSLETLHVRRANSPIATARLAPYPAQEGAFTDLVCST